MTAPFTRLRRDALGTSLIEYALLAALVGLAGYTALTELGPSIEFAYQSWGSEVMRLWEPRDPQ